MNIYCAGIGGIGLSAYAAFQKQAGHDVSGSDRTESDFLDTLRGQGISVTTTQDGSGIPENTELFVYSEALPEDHPERVRAAECGIRMQNYFEALGDLSRGHTVIAVCGTHGKSSTAAMASRMLLENGKDPSVILGTKIRELPGGNWRHGKSDLFVVEACEYRRDFRFLSPDIILMTNVDGDHFDAFSSVEDYQQAFAEFLQLLPEDGIVITHGNDADCARLAKESGREYRDADHHAFPALGTPGKHMQQNAQLALELAAFLGISDASARAALEGYKGAWRRMELKGVTSEGIVVIDDYAHHPKEIRAVLNTAKGTYAGHRIVCVFQPHTHARTITFYDEFCAAFSDADMVIIPNIYDARSAIETDRVDEKKLVLDIQQYSDVAAIHGVSLERTEQLLHQDVLKPGDILLCLGAGDITDLATALVA